MKHLLIFLFPISLNELIIIDKYKLFFYIIFAFFIHSKLNFLRELFAV